MVGVYSARVQVEYLYRETIERYLEKLLREVVDTVVNRRERLISTGVSTILYVGGT